MGLGGSKKAGDVILDMDSTAGGGDSKVRAEFDALLSESKTELKLIEDYKGCRELARKAMSQPTKENEQAAFEGLLEAVDAIAQFFHYTNEINRILPGVLLELSKRSLAEQQGLAAALARLFDFALVFDNTRMMRPNLSNDFSYYRRLLPKFSKHPGVKVKDDEASGMALFTAEHIPMFCTISKSTNSFTNEQLVAVQNMLASLANSCLRMLKTKKFSDSKQTLTCARAMTGAIVLYDRMGPVSAFSKRSGIAIRDCIVVLKREYPKETSLLNAIQYSTKSFKEAPAAVQEMFE